VRTLANAMDVGNPSNFARMLALYGGDADRMRADVEWATLTDAQTRDVIARIFREHGRVLDPHSAVACSGLEPVVGQGASTAGIFLATAHPAKFAEVVEPVIRTRVPLPPRLADCLRREPRVARIEATLDRLKQLLD